MTIAAMPRRRTSGAGLLRRRTLHVLAFLLCLGILFYGALAVDSGFSNWAASGNAETTAERIALKNEADAEGAAPIEHAASRVRYPTLSIVALFAPDRYTYGSDGLMDTLIHYGEMPRLNATVLVVHNVLAGACLLFAAFQFWPMFRHRLPAWHRRFGMFYVVVAQLAMLMAMAYLLLTPVAHIYDHLTFYCMLWFLAISVTVSLWLAMFNLWRGNIGQHMGYMSLNFGLLLTAPVLRAGWVLMGIVNPAARQIESNFAINGILIPASFLIGYAIFTVNRFMQQKRARPALLTEPQPANGTVRVLLVVIAAIGVYQLLMHGFFRPGLAAMGLPADTMPSGVFDLDREFFVGETLTRWLFVFAGVAGIVLAARGLWRRSTGRHGASWLAGDDRWWLAIAALVAGIIQLQWGEAMGLPSFATLTGGALYVFGGAVTLIFAGLLAVATHRGWADWADEWGGFVLGCLLATPLFWIVLPMIASSSVDQAFRNEGHLYRLAGIVQWGILIVPFLFAIHGRATTNRLSR